MARSVCSECLRGRFLIFGQFSDWNLTKLILAGIQHDELAAVRA
jgi:hypothetical protein